MCTHGGFLVWGKRHVIARKRNVAKNRMVINGKKGKGIDRASEIIYNYGNVEKGGPENRCVEESMRRTWIGAIMLCLLFVGACARSPYYYYLKGDYNRTIRECSKFMEYEPGYAPAYNLRGLAHYYKGNYSVAIRDFTRAIEINPRDAVVYSLRAATYRDKGEHGPAISDYTKAIDLDGRFAEAYVGRATAYYRKGDFDRAWSDVRRAQRLGLRVPPELLNALRKASPKE